jgi:predicted Zn-dependent protease
MLRLCTNEDELAAVLAHEIAHVQLNHGLRAIKSSRITSASTILLAESAKQLGGEALRDLTMAFEGSIMDISQTMMNNGYSRGYEREADAACLVIMKRLGYDPTALATMLTAMGHHLEPGGLDFAKTHPKPESRITDIRKALGASVTVLPPPAARQKRFEAAMKGI